MKIKRTITILLVLLMVVSALLASCSKNQSQTGTQSGVDTTGATNVDPEDTVLRPDVPEDANFEGYEFKFINVDQNQIFWAMQTLDVEKSDGDLLNDTIYSRNLKIEEQLNITITEIPSLDPAGDMIRSVTANANDYDALFVSAMTAVGAASQGGYMLDLNSIPYIDLDKPWWSQSANDTLSIMNRLYFAASDIGLSYFDSAMPLAMNKQMISAYNLENPYKLVDEGKWTIDAIKPMLLITSEDLDGNGISTTDDQFGFFGMSEEYPALVVAAGENIIQKDENDIPYLAFMNERFILALEKAIDALNQSNVFCNFRLAKYSIAPGDLSVFTSGRALFFSDVLFWISGLRNMEQDFAILPRPKLDEEQEKYYTYVHESATILGVPKTTEDIERTGIILESLAAESYHTVIPTYYDVVLSDKYARDEDSIRMLDYIFENRVFDLGCVYNWGNIYSQIKQIGETGNVTIASLYASVENRVRREINNLIEEYEKIELG